MPTLPDIEAAIAAEAAAHAQAAAALNPFGEAEFVELGSARLVYSGAISPVHGVYGLGLDGSVEERDWQEIQRFFSRKERAPNFWLTPFTDKSVRETIAATHRLTLTQKVSGWLTLAEPTQQIHDAYINGPDHGDWSLQFSRREDASRTEPDLLSVTKIHQRETRFYLDGAASSYTFFSKGIALVPHPHPVLLETQEKEAGVFRASAFIVMGEVKNAPLLYERFLYEPI